MLSHLNSNNIKRPVSGFGSSWSLLFILFELNILIWHPRRAYYSLQMKLCCVYGREDLNAGLTISCLFHCWHPISQCGKGWEAGPCVPPHKADSAAIGRTNNHRRIRVQPYLQTYIQTNRLPAEIVFFPSHISSLLLLLSSFIPSFPSLLLKRWHRAAPKPVFNFLFFF